jgi:Ca-activated chloride channel family protein
MNLIGAIWSALGLLAVASLFANPSLVYGAAPQYYSPSSDNITRGSLISRSALGEEQHLPLVDSDVSITITGQIARVQVSQHFENPTDEWIEGLYLFPLPHDAAVDTMRMDIGGRIIEGQIQEKQQALETYKTAKKEGKRAALVEQDRPNLFNTSLANIPPHGNIIVNIEYQQSVQWDGGVFRLRYPMSITPRYKPEEPARYLIESKADVSSGWTILPDERPQAVAYEEDGGTVEGKTKLEVSLSPGFQVGQVQSLFHGVIENASSDGTILLSLDGGAVRSDRDFVLEWTPAATSIPTASFFSESADQGDFGLLTLLPPTLKDWGNMAREVIFVIDVSGSMKGEPLRAAKASLTSGIEGLGHNDTFNVVAFNNKAAAFYDAPVRASGKFHRAALKVIDGLKAGGGTEMAAAFELALQMPGDPDRLQQVVFITDGAVSNEAALFNQIKGELGARRLFTVGIGSAPNTFFMEEAARFGRGTYTYIGDTASAERIMRDLFTKISFPALTNIEVQGEGVEDIAPGTIPDLYAGEPLSIAMKLGQGNKAITVKGRLGDTEWKRTVTLSPAGNQSGIRVDWARKRIADWQRAGYLGLDKDRVRSEVLSLALNHHLVSRYTSLVAVDVTPVRPSGIPFHKSIVSPTAPHGIAINLAQTSTGFAATLIVGLLMAMMGTIALLWRRPSYRGQS